MASKLDKTERWLDYRTKEYESYIALTCGSPIFMLTIAIVLQTFGWFTGELAVFYILCAMALFFASLFKAREAQGRMKRIIEGKSETGL